MTDIGEQIAVSVASPSAEGPCWYCEEEPKEEDLSNEEVADPETSDSEGEEAVPENHEKNDASKLGKNLGDKPLWTITCPENDSAAKVYAAAHHCVPGNASFKKATKLLRYMRQGGPLGLTSDVGYNINHQNNGVWLAGNYYVRGGNDPYDKNWGAFDKAFKDSYAARAIKKSGRQFHDAHPEYSEKVLKTLESIASKIGKPKKKCPVCDKEFKKQRPPYGLVSKVDRVSSEHRTMLTTVSKRLGKKFVQNGYFVSSRVKTYFGL